MPDRGLLLPGPPVAPQGGLQQTLPAGAFGAQRRCQLGVVQGGNNPPSECMELYNMCWEALETGGSAIAKS
eukprot:535034-Alexandrium_andersonii.AAC.1